MMVTTATIRQVTATDHPPQPSGHALSLAGVDLPDATPPVVRVEPAREVVVVLPRSRMASREVHLDRCRDDGVSVVVRPSGGGAVVLSPGVVAASVVAAVDPAPQFPEPYFRLFGTATTVALAACGAPGLVVRGVSDLCFEDRKIAGSALRLWRARVLYQVSVLVDPDLALFERYLPPPSRAPDYRRGRAHADFVTTLRATGCHAGVDAVAAALSDSLAEVVERLRAGAPSVYSRPGSRPWEPSHE
jgi:lipoate---protein ligase